MNQFSSVWVISALKILGVFAAFFLVRWVCAIIRKLNNGKGF